MTASMFIPEGSLRDLWFFVTRAVLDWIELSARPLWNSTWEAWIMVKELGGIF
jgi:hypothetical protein